MSYKGMDVTKNMRLVERLKSDMLLAVSHLFAEMASDTCEDIRDVALDTLSDTIIISYLLARRLGLEYPAIERQISSKIRLGLLEEHETEKYFGDLSALARTRSYSPNAG
ncbi:MAG: MazG-like family protein [Clostridia bacterium]|nr:MazG-like family protein [Clostridia bacterium]